jgi:hypothetical protein
MYTNETTSGDILGTYSDQQQAITEAKTRLEDDPELGEVHVCRVEVIGRATHVPDSDWQSVVAWLWEGEKILPPGPVPAVFACDPDESCGYALSDPKHPGFHSIHADIWDARAGK